jgi:hypothetical protein
MPILRTRILTGVVATLMVASATGCAGKAEQAAEPAAEPAGSPGDHVKFFVIGKSWHYEQDVAGEVTLVDLGYFAEIFKTVEGVASDARMQLEQPGSEPIPFVREADGGAVLHGRAGKRHEGLAALDAELPNGDYVFSFTTPAGEVKDYEVTLAGEDGKTDLPPAPKITLAQDGKPVASNEVAPGVDVLVGWTPFDTGRADPNGIADDLIFVMMADCRGERAFHSGRPLGTPNPLEPDRESSRVLTFKDTEITIPGDAFAPGITYKLDVEHARLLDTDQRHGVVGMSTFAVTTHLHITVTGEAPEGACESKGSE